MTCPRCGQRLYVTPAADVVLYLKDHRYNHLVQQCPHCHQTSRFFVDDDTVMTVIHDLNIVPLFLLQLDDEIRRDKAAQSGKPWIPRQGDE
jgi:RNase P subunit RPR2